MPFIIDARNMGGGSIGSAAGGDTSTGTRNNVTLAAPWDENKEYLKGDLATNNGDLYQAQKSVPAGVQISDEDYWALVVAGDKSKETEQLRKDIGSLGDLETESKDNLVNAINEVNSIQPDWNQNDETKKDYIKNRPFYEASEESAIFSGDVTFVKYTDSSPYAATYQSDSIGNVDNDYRIVIKDSNGKIVGDYTYSPVLSEDGDTSYIMLGDMSEIRTSVPINQSDPNFNNRSFYTFKKFSANNICNITIYEKSLVVKQLDPKYIPTDISLGLTSAAVGQTIKVKSIDESGKPTAWNAVDLPQSGLPPYIVTLEQDEDGNFSFPGTISDMEAIEAMFYSGRRVLTIIDDSNRTKRMFVLTAVSRTSNNLFVEALRFTAAYPDADGAYSVVDRIAVRYSGSSITVIREKASIMLSDINGLKANAIVPTPINQGSFGYWYVDGNSAFGVISANPGKYAITYVSSIYGNLPLYLSSISDTEIIYKNTAADGSWVGFKIGANSSSQDCSPIAGTLNVQPVFEARLFPDSSIPNKLNLESGIAVGDLVNAFDERKRVIARLCVNEDDYGMPFEMQMYLPGSSSNIPDTIMFAPCSIPSAPRDGGIQSMSTIIIGFQDGNWYFSGFSLDAIGGRSDYPYTIPFEINATSCNTFAELVSATQNFRWRAYIYKGDHKLYLQVPEYSSSVTPNILYFTGITEPDGSGISSCVWTTVRIPVSSSNVILWDDSTLATSNTALDTWDYYKLNKDQSGALRVYDVFNEKITNLGLVGKGVIEYGDYRYLFNCIAGYSLLFYCMDFTNSSVPKISTISINRRTNTIGVTNFHPIWEVATESEVNNAVDNIFKTI